MVGKLPGHRSIGERNEIASPRHIGISRVRAVEAALATAEGLSKETGQASQEYARHDRKPFRPVRVRTSILLIVISLAAVAGVAYGSYRASNETHSLETRVTVLEQASHDSASRVEQLTADRRKLCTTVDRVRQKITGVILTPGSPPPNFDVEADPLSAPDRIILALYNWCQAVP
jgi:hypothetical protein